jgi:hypothetical protein
MQLQNVAGSEVDRDLLVNLIAVGVCREVLIEVAAGEYLDAMETAVWALGPLDVLDLEPLACRDPLRDIWVKPSDRG